jgi:hypothetical protein
LEATISATSVSSLPQPGISNGKLTLNISHALLENLLQDLGVLQLLLDLGDDALGELPLLPLLDLALVPHPRIQDSLGLGSQRRLLLELIGLSLELGGFLGFVSVSGTTPVTNRNRKHAYLGHLEEGLGDVNDTRHLLDIHDAVLDGLRMVGTRRVQDVLDLLGLRLGPLLVHGTTKLDQGTPDAEKAEGNNRLLVDDIVLVADGVDRETGSRREDGRLGDQAAARERIDDGLRLGLGILDRDVRGLAGRGEGGDGGKDARNDARSQAGGPFGELIVSD